MGIEKMTDGIDARPTSDSTKIVASKEELNAFRDFITTARPSDAIDEDTVDELSRHLNAAIEAVESDVRSGWKGTDTAASTKRTLIVDEKLPRLAKRVADELEPHVGEWRLEMPGSPNTRKAFVEERLKPFRRSPEPTTTA